jgi:type I restriction enzyme, R subunit
MNELTDEEKELFEDTFNDETGQESSDSAVNQWLFNDSTIDQLLNDLMEKGIRVEGGDKLGKTIIFANNYKHAKRIVRGSVQGEKIANRIINSRLIRI